MRPVVSVAKAAENQRSVTKRTNLSFAQLNAMVASASLNAGYASRAGTAGRTQTLLAAMTHVPSCALTLAVESSHPVRHLDSVGNSTTVVIARTALQWDSQCAKGAVPAITYTVPPPWMHVSHTLLK